MGNGKPQCDSSRFENADLVCNIAGGEFAMSNNGDLISFVFGRRFFQTPLRLDDHY